jgi:hypothetical protein
MKAFIARHPVATFITLTLGFQLSVVVATWLSIPEGGHMHDAPVAHMIFRLRVFGPLLFALAITALIDGRTGLRKLFLGYFHWRVPAKWYLLAASWKFLFTWSGMILIAGLGVAEWPGWVTENFFWPLMKNMAFLVGIAIVEETSWMKFGVTRLHQRFNALHTSLIIGLSWGLWYLPMMIIGEGVPDGIPWWVFLVSMFSLTVFLNWAHNMTHSGLVLLLMQIVSNCAFFITPVLPAWTGGPVFVSAFVGMFFLGAGFLILWYGPKELGEGPRARWDDPVLRRVYDQSRLMGSGQSGLPRVA